LKKWIFDCIVCDEFVD